MQHIVCIATLLVALANAFDPKPGSYLKPAAPVIAPQPTTYQNTNSYVSQALWDQWSAWSQCSVTCGQGQIRRTRSCRIGKCEGPTEEMNSCPMGQCPEWQQWGGWTTCSSTCGPTGRQKRSRLCSTYFGCEGSRDEEQQCNTQTSCAFWTQWSEYGACSKACDGGVATRTRECTVYGGCQGVASEDKACNPHPCCSAWSDWSTCSMTCLPAGASPDVAQQARQKRCQESNPSAAYGGYASRLETENRACQGYGLPPCATWGDWGKWERCTVTCGGGISRRTRSCTGTGDCVGSSNENQQCNPDACPKFNEWGDWSKCSVTCGTGFRERRRVCTVEGLCDGDSVQRDPTCNKFGCPQWTEWANWGQCSSSCGGGQQKRSRVCSQYILCEGSNIDERDCNSHLCPLAGDWEGWSDCSALCGGGSRVRRRACLTDGTYCQGDEVRLRDAPPTTDTRDVSRVFSRLQNDFAASFLSSIQRDAPPTLTDVAKKASCVCDGPVEDGAACNMHKCAQWTQWEQWGQCTLPCAGGQKTRKRTCDFDKAFCIGANAQHPSCLCEGSDTDTEPCNTHQCPNWSEWGNWGQCSQSCGGGSKERKRTCITDPTYCTAATAHEPTCQCEGLDHSNDICNVQLCPIWDEWTGWSECSELCNGGTSTRARQCLMDGEYCTVQKISARDPICVCVGDELESRDCNQHQCAVFEQWQQWTTCTVSCGGGTKERQRSCNIDRNVCYGDRLLTDPSCACFEGDNQEKAECATVECSRWEQWQEWGACSVSCGGGSQTRNRVCWTDQVFCSGTDAITNPACKCEGPADATQQCNTHSCPVWKPWAEWTQCSTTCGDGQRTRDRVCQKDATYCQSNPTTKSCNCEGEAKGTEACDAGPCYSWGTWMAWSQCSTVCGGGSRNRARGCPVAGACPGLSEESEICNQIPCPDWGSWGEWSSCSVTCNGGQRVRTRACPLEGGCSPGEAFDVEVCGDEVCPVWAQWGSWGSCSAICGQGSRTRTRACDRFGKCLGRDTEDEECFAGACVLTTFWSAWSPCTQTCGGGVKIRSRVLAPTPGSPTEREQEPCETQACPEWTLWGGWTTCSVTCGGGSRTRDRTCADATGKQWVNGCVGKKVENDPAGCNTFGCTTG